MDLKVEGGKIVGGSVMPLRDWQIPMAYWFWACLFVAVSIVVDQWLKVNGWLVWVDGEIEFWFEQDLRRWIHGR